MIRVPAEKPMAKLLSVVGFRFGVVELGLDKFVRGFREKPRLRFWANTGTFVATPEFFSYLPKKGDDWRMPSNARLIPAACFRVILNRRH